MENKAIARTLRFLSQLMDLHKENPFRVKSVANAAFKVDKLPFAITSKKLEEIENIDGIGKSIASKIIELLQSNEIEELNALIAKTPPGIIEMLGIKGIGPKKIAVIWQDLQIESLGELYYACNENRLIEAKGFGQKTQDEIKKIIEFRMAANGKFLYAQAEPIIAKWHKNLSEWLNSNDRDTLLGIAGDFRRKCEIIENAIFIIGSRNKEIVSLQLENSNFENLQKDLGEETFSLLDEEGLSIKIHLVDSEDFYLNYFILTGNNSHVDAILEKSGIENFGSEEEIYSKANLSFIAPELREGLDEIQLASNHQLPNLITNQQLKGSLHNHSNWSDGVHTLEDMALYCKDVLKLEYLGICDHSKSAFYANGLNEQRVIAQQKQIDELNIQLAPFKIFKGIESDILYDGSLDYEENILKTFDFIVASVHSQLKMDKDKATQRLIRAIENPYTTILGHPTGRLLLSRKGYEIDQKKVIDACAINQVVIEINANPLRLDLDWRWHRYALEKGVLLSINPDAHRKEGFHDTEYGIFVARKGGLSADKCLNAFSLAEISAYFEKRKV